MLRWCLLGVLASLIPGLAQPLGVGPLASEFRLVLEPGQRFESFGPFYSTQQREDEDFWAIHPFFSRTDYGADATEVDVLYPLFTYDRFGPESRWQLLQLLSGTSGRTAAGGEIHRRTVFPFYFEQRSAAGTNDYRVFFPFYGTLRNRLFRDEITFKAWPFYVRSHKGAQMTVPDPSAPDVPVYAGGFTTENVLFPFYHRRYGEGLHGWQVWPLAGYEEKLAGLRTNLWGDVEPTPGHRKKMALWPFFLEERRQLGTPNPEHEIALLPFFSRFHSPQRDSITVPWPLGLTLTDDRGKGYREWGAPWPLVVFARGPGKTVDRVWPFYSRAHAGSLSSGFFLWPLYKVNTFDSPPLWRERKRVLFFLYSDVVERATDTGRENRRTDLWPLFTASVNAEGGRRLQLFAPFEPLIPNNKSLIRNWSPLWSVWRSERNPGTGDASTSVLWNLVRSDTTATGRKCSLLFGLFQYQTSPDGKRWRLLGIPFRGKPAAPRTPQS